MKIKLLFLTGLLAVLAGCGGPRVTTIPDVSPPLIQEEVFSWVGQVAGNMLFPCAAGIGWVDKSGRIGTWDPEKKAPGPVWPLPFAVEDPPFRQGVFLTIRSQTKDQWLVFDLVRMEIVWTASVPEATQVLGMDGRHWVYLDGENLAVRQGPDPDAVFRQPVADKEFFNCHFFPERILILSRRHLFVFWRQSGKFQQLPLPLPAASEFVFLGEHIYYGSSQRQLVKYSLREKKMSWKTKLGHDLERRPQIKAATVVLSTADNNVLQMSQRGSVRWWLALDSILEYALLPMTDHLAAFLLNRHVAFIDVRRQLVTYFKIQGRPAGMPLACKDNLYFLLQDAGNAQKLQRVGNHYGIDLELAPGPAQWLGMPVTVSFQTNNLLTPRSQCLIRAEAGETVLLKKFKTARGGQLVWLPAKTGTYRLRVSAAALNRQEEKEIAVQVFDPRALMALVLCFF